MIPTTDGGRLDKIIKKITGIVLALMLLTASTACADSAVDVIMNTGTTQAFTDEAVPSADLETILRAGLSTESAINQQPWFFVAVTNPEMMQEIAGSGMGGFTPPAGTGDKPEGAPAGGTDGFPGGAPEGAPEGMPQNAPGGDMPAAPSFGGGSAKASLGDSPATPPPAKRLKRRRASLNKPG